MSAQLGGDDQPAKTRAILGAVLFLRQGPVSGREWPHPGRPHRQTGPSAGRCRRCLFAPNLGSSRVVGFFAAASIRSFCSRPETLRGYSSLSARFRMRAVRGFPSNSQMRSAEGGRDRLQSRYTSDRRAWRDLGKVARLTAHSPADLSISAQSLRSRYHTRCWVAWPFCRSTPFACARVDCAVVPYHVVCLCAREKQRDAWFGCVEAW